MSNNLISWEVVLTRYCKQRDAHSCGLVAALNSMKWAGGAVSYEKIKSMQRVKGFSKHSGIAAEDFIPFLQRVLKNVCAIKYVVSPRLLDITEQLWGGGAVLLCYEVVPRAAHYCLLTDVTPSGKTFTAVNFHRGETVTALRKSTLQKCLHKKSKWAATAWFLKRISPLGRVSDGGCRTI